MHLTGRSHLLIDAGLYPALLRSIPLSFLHPPSGPHFISFLSRPPALFLFHLAVNLFSLSADPTAPPGVCSSEPQDLQPARLPSPAMLEKVDLTLEAPSAGFPLHTLPGSSLAIESSLPVRGRPAQAQPSPYPPQQSYSYPPLRFPPSLRPWSPMGAWCLTTIGFLCAVAFWKSELFSGTFPIVIFPVCRSRGSFIRSSTRHILGSVRSPLFSLSLGLGLDSS